MTLVSRYFMALSLIWVVAMTWRIYPQFKDTIRVDGRLTTIGDYLDDTCGQKLGPAATTCLGEERARTRELLRREQGKSVLLIEAPLLGYLAIYFPLWLLADRAARRRAAPQPLG